MSQLLVKLIADFNTTLASKVAASATTATLTSATDDDGDALAAGTYGFTIDRNNSSKEFFTAVLSGTSLSSIKTIDRGTGAGTAGFALKHRKGAEIVITDFVAIKRMLDVLDGTTDWDSATKIKYDGAVSHTPGSNELATVAYVDSVSIAGAADATTTTKGIVEEATQAEIDAGTAAGGTSARLFINPSTLATSIYGTQLPSSGQKDALAGSSGTPGSGNTYITEDDVASAATASKIARRLAGGNITVVTESQGNNSTNAASTAYVDTAVANKFLTYTNGETTYDVSTASGTKNIAHGLGAIPKKVRLTFMSNNSVVAGGNNVAVLVYNGTTASCVGRAGSNGATRDMNGTDVVLYGPTGGSNTEFATGVITFDATNIILTFTKTNSPTGTYDIVWEAEDNMAKIKVQQGTQVKGGQVLYDPETARKLNPGESTYIDESLLLPNTGGAPGASGASGASGGTANNTGSSPAGSAASILQSFQYNPTPEDSGYSDAIRSFLDVNRADASQNIDQGSIYNNKLAEFQAQIDATNKIYADMLNKARIEGQGRLESRKFAQGRAGQIGSGTGEAALNAVQDANTQVEQSIQNEQQAKIAEIMGLVRKSAATELENKTKAKRAGAEALLKFYDESPARKEQRLSPVVQALISQGIDPNNLTPEDLDTITSNLGVSKEDVISAYTKGIIADDKAQLEANKSVLEQEKLTAEIDNLINKYDFEAGQKELDRALEEKKIDISRYNAETNRIKALKDVEDNNPLDGVKPSYSNEALSLKVDENGRLKTLFSGDADPTAKMQELEDLGVTTDSVIKVQALLNKGYSLKQVAQAVEMPQEVYNKMKEFIVIQK